MKKTQSIFKDETLMIIINTALKSYKQAKSPNVHITFPYHKTLVVYSVNIYDHYVWFLFILFHLYLTR